jgi:hypothetical protein
MNDDTIIISGVAIMVASTIVRHQASHSKNPVAVSWGKPVAFGFFLAIALLLLAMPFPKFARALTYLGLVGAFAVNGPAVFKLVGGVK